MLDGTDTSWNSSNIASALSAVKDCTIFTNYVMDLSQLNVDTLPMLENHTKMTDFIYNNKKIKTIPANALKNTGISDDTVILKGFYEFDKDDGTKLYILNQKYLCYKNQYNQNCKECRAVDGIFVSTSGIEKFPERDYESTPDGSFQNPYRTIEDAIADSNSSSKIIYVDGTITITQQITIEDDLKIYELPLHYINGQGAGSKKDAYFTSNSTYDSLGTFYFEYGHIEFKNIKFNSLKAERGGAFFIFGAYVQCDNCTFTDCQSTGSGGGGGGGAIYVNDMTSELYCKNCKFVNCKGNNGKGGAICSSEGRVKCESCIFDTCSVNTSGNGSAAYLFVGEYGDGTFKECTFTNCSVESNVVVKEEDGIITINKD